MSKIIYTNEQLAAINTEGSNVLVSAAAGCGKTTLMIERIVRKVLINKVSLDKIIVVTFTEAAAAELKERLEKALNKQLQQEKDNAFLQQQLALLNDAYISTFHSLCLRLLEENGGTFNYDKKIKIGDSLQIKNLKKQAFKLLDEQFINEDNYLQLKDYFTTIYDDSNLFTLLDKTLEICITKGSLKEFITYNQQNLNLTSVFDYPLFNNLLFESTTISINYIISLLKQALQDDNNEKTEQNITETFHFFNDLTTSLTNQDYSALHQKLSNYKIFTRPRVSKDNLNIQINKVHPRIKEELEKQLQPLYRLSNEEYLKMISDNQTNVSHVLYYVSEYNKILAKLKKEQGLLEFNDLEQEALHLLYDDNDTFSQRALALQNNFNEIMIDEYQDTNLIQEKIVLALANDHNVFMVGDVKQAIYGFRNATPQLFSEKYQSYQNNLKGKVIDLDTNFRSKKEVLETTNFIFKSIFSANIGGINYDDKNTLKFGNKKLNDYTGDYTTKFFCNVYDKDDKLKINDLYLKTSQAITNEIKKLNSRGVNYNEITILFRNRQHSTILTDLFKQENIPYMIHDNKGFYASYEIKDLINLLKALTNPSDDIALLGVLRSYFFNLNENDLLTISLLSGQNNYQKLKHSTYQETYNLFEKLRIYALEHRPLELINYIYQETNYLTYLYNSNHYEQVLINITSFKTMLEDNIDYYNSLSYLVSELDYNIARDFDTAKPATLSSKENVVNIMTIHKSKGLEFNYVFLFDESKIRFENRNSSTNINYLGKQLILKYFDTKQKIYADNPLTNLIAFDNKKEILAEEFRILYVALTRAKLQLYIFTNISREALEESVEAIRHQRDWLIEEDYLIKLKKMLDSLILSLVRHKDGLKLRESLPVEASDDIYNYYGKLFEVNDYDYSLLSSTNQLQTIDKYPIKNVVKLNQESTSLEGITPSNHAIRTLNFDDISSFDSFEQGTNVHKLFELIDFNNPNFDDLLVKYPLYSRNKEGLEAFFNDDFFNVIKDNFYRKEYAFIYQDEDNLIKGFIDLYVESATTIYIVDYKTDKISQDELIEQYTKQLAIYEDIISKNTSKEIVKMIYSLYHKKFITL